MNTKETSPVAPQELDTWFLDLLACPGCEQRHPLHLNATKDALDCLCGRYAYPIRDGIPVLLLDEAAILDDRASPDSIE